MITRIEATNYRCLEKADIDFEEFTLLVGANGSGKTTLLGIPELFSDCFKSPSVSQAFILSQNDAPPRCSAFEELVFHGQGNYFSIALEAKIPQKIMESLTSSLSETAKKNSEEWWQFIRYEIRFEIVDNKLIVGTENLFLFPSNKKPERGIGRIYGDYALPKGWRSILMRGSNNVSGLRVETTKNAKTKNLEVANSLLALPKVKFESQPSWAFRQSYA